MASRKPEVTEGRFFIIDGNVKHRGKIIDKSSVPDAFLDGKFD